MRGTFFKLMEFRGSQPLNAHPQKSCLSDTIGAFQEELNLFMSRRRELAQPLASIQPRAQLQGSNGMESCTKSWLRGACRYLVYKPCQGSCMQSCSQTKSTTLSWVAIKFHLPLIWSCDTAVNTLWDIYQRVGRLSI